MKYKWFMLGGIVAVGGFMAFFSPTQELLVKMIFASSTMAQNAWADDVPMWEADRRPLLSKERWEELADEYFGDGRMHDSFIIPGLRGAWSVNYETKQPAFSTNWTPQGVTQNEKYFFVSAYDGNRENNSLIFLLDKKSGEYIKSLVLPNKAHVGGLAYDPEHRLVWVSADNRTVAKVSALKEETIEKYDAKKIKKPITFDYTAPFPWITSTSSIDCSDRTMWIPNFSIEKGQSTIFGVPINPEDGTIDTESLAQHEIPEEITDELGIGIIGPEILKHVSISSGFPKMQGLAILDSMAFFSTSYGPRDSSLIATRRTRRQDYEHAGGSWEFEELLQVKLPPYLEEASIDSSSGLLALVFESGASQYREKTPKVVDRLVRIRVDSLGFRELNVGDD